MSIFRYLSKMGGFSHPLSGNHAAPKNVTGDVPKCGSLPLLSYTCLIFCAPILARSILALAAPSPGTSRYLGDACCGFGQAGVGVGAVGMSLLVCFKSTRSVGHGRLLQTRA